MTARRLAPLSLALMLVAGCGMFGGGSAASTAEPLPPAPFVNRVWAVVEGPSDIPAGTLYAFLTDNSLLVAAPGAARPRLGRWHYAGGGLVLIENGFRYPADILEQGPDRFAIRIHRDAGLVDVIFAPAPTSVIPSVSEESGG